MNAPQTISGCPTATRPVLAREGLLMRLSVPAGRLPADALGAFAAGCEALGVTTLDVTNRANLQIRGLAPDQAERLAGLAMQCGLLPAAHAGRRRAIVASPLAGLDPDETADPAPVIAALDAALLADRRTDLLSPKCGFGVDGGGRWPVRRRSLDMVFEAEDGRWRVVAAGRDLGLTVAETDVGRAVFALTDRLRESGAERARDLPSVALVAALSAAADATPAPPAPVRAAAKPFLGPIETGDPARVALGAVAPFGTLPVSAAAALAEIAARHSGEVRLSPDRTILLPGVDRGALAEVRQALEANGLSTDPASPFALIHACIGLEGCLRAENDVRAAARAIAAGLGTTPHGLRHIHVSGCARGCAHPRRADILLLADGKGGYALRRDADARLGDGIALAAGLSPAEAAAAVRSLVDAERALRG